MDERRKYFRQPFADDARPDVTLWTTNRNNAFAGKLWDLSLGGVGVALDIFAQQPKIDSPVWVSFSTPEGMLDFYCTVLHRRMVSGSYVYGCRFLPLVDGIANTQREQKLWRYLLLAQRTAKQEKTGVPAPRTFHDWNPRSDSTHHTFHGIMPPPFDH